MTPTAERKAKATDAPRARPLIDFKVLGTADDPGTFEAIVSVAGNIDSYGDRMRLGAFEQTLKPPPEGRGFAPIVWTHAWNTPPIGVSLEMRELDLAGLRDAGAVLPDDTGIEGGLYTKGRLLVRDDEDHAIAKQVWAGMKAQGGDGRPALREWSFGFRTKQSQWVELDPATLPPEAQWTGGEIRDVLAVELFEVGPTLVGANHATESLAVKSAVLDLELRGKLGAAEAAAIRAAIDGEAKADGPDAGARRAELNAEVKARLDQLTDFKPPAAL